MKRKIGEQEQMFHEALGQENTLSDLSIMYENAMAERGLKITAGRVSKGQRGLQFTVNPELPGWVNDLSDRLAENGQEGPSEGVTGTKVAEGPVSSQIPPFSRQEMARLLDLLTTFGLIPKV